MHRSEGSFHIIGVQFREDRPICHFRCGDLSPNIGDCVVVEMEQGVVLGKVVYSFKNLPHPCGKLKSVLRIANVEDLEQDKKNRSNEKEAYDFCQKRIIDRNLPMNLVRVESLLDGSKIIFYYTAKERVDFRELVKDLVRKFHTRIEMRQIGVRNKAKMTGGLGICGRELCCAAFLNDFEPISIKMAKEQNLALNPTKISGTCGRLMCCLTFEYQNYLASKGDVSRESKN